MNQQFHSEIEWVTRNICPQNHCRYWLCISPETTSDPNNAREHGRSVEARQSLPRPWQSSPPIAPERGM